MVMVLVLEGVSDERGEWWSPGGRAPLQTPGTGVEDGPSTELERKPGSPLLCLATEASAAPLNA